MHCIGPTARSYRRSPSSRPRPGCRRRRLAAVETPCRPGQPSSRHRRHDEQAACSGDCLAGLIEGAVIVADALLVGCRLWRHAAAATAGCRPASASSCRKWASDCRVIRGELVRPAADRADGPAERVCQGHCRWQVPLHVGLALVEVALDLEHGPVRLAQTGEAARAAAELPVVGPATGRRDRADGASRPGSSPG